MVNTKFSNPPNQSKGILDDYAVRKDIATREGTIEHIPTLPKHITNKEFVESAIEGAKAKFDDAFNLIIIDPDTEYSVAIPDNTKRIRFKIRRDYENQVSYRDWDLRWSWETGKVASKVSPYFTLEWKEEYFIDGLNVTGATLYFASPGTNNVVEIETWD